MKHSLFAIFDSKAKAFLPPFMLPNSEMAVRAFSDCVNDPAHQFARHPADYTLFKVGEFDDGDAAPIRNADVVEALAHAVQLRRAPVVQRDLVGDLAEGCQPIHLATVVK